MPLTVLSILLHRAVARDVHFGDKSCYLNSSHYTGHDDDADGSGNVQDKTKECADQKNSTQCLALAPQCEWNYSGVGVQYQASEKTPLKVNSSDPRKPSPPHICKRSIIGIHTHRTIFPKLKSSN